MAFIAVSYSTVGLQLGSNSQLRIEPSRRISGGRGSLSVRQVRVAAPGLARDPLLGEALIYVSKNTSARSSILRRGGASFGVVGSSNAV